MALPQATAALASPPTTVSYPQPGPSDSGQASQVVISPSVSGAAAAAVEEKRDAIANAVAVVATEPLANAPTTNAPAPSTTQSTPTPAPLTGSTTVAPQSAPAQTGTPVVTQNNPPAAAPVVEAPKVVAPLNTKFGLEEITKIRAAFKYMMDNVNQPNVKGLDEAIKAAENLYASNLRYVVGFNLDAPVVTPKEVLDLEEDVKLLLNLQTRVERQKTDWLATPEPKVDIRKQIVTDFGKEFKPIADRIWNRYDSIRKVHQKEDSIVVSTQHANLDSKHLKNVSDSLHIDPVNYQKNFEAPAEEIWEQHYKLSRQVESANNESIALLRNIAGVIEQLGKAISDTRGYPATQWIGQVAGGLIAKSPFEGKRMQYTLHCTPIDKTAKPV